jgi:hypothetical protein
MTVTINGTSGVTFPDASTQNTSPKTGFVNRIINGGMTIDQRNAGASVSVANSEDKYPVDRFFISNRTGTGVFSGQQSTTAPAGFKNSLIVTTTTANASLTASQYGAIRQGIEGFNVSDLGWGTASAQPVTLSFWVRSSLTGTFGGSFLNASFDRSYPFTYTISAANTYEYKTVTIAGDTSGTWLTNNGRGLQTRFNLGSGSSLLTTANSWQAGSFIGVTDSVSVVGTNGATFYITGVQLEKGSTATPFERRQFGTELALCQRYYYKTATVATGIISTGAFADSTTSFSGYANFPVRLRATPTALSQSGTAGDYSWNGTSGIACSAVPGFSTRTTTDIWQVNFTVASGLTAGHGGSVITSNGNGFLAWSAEL